MIFLIGTERSGTNLLLRILNAHSELCGPAPLHMIRYTLRNIDKFGTLHIEENWKRLVEYCHDLYTASLHPWKCVITVQELLEGVPKGNLNQLFTYVYKKEGSANNKSMLLVKESHIHQYRETFLEIFTNPTFIHIVRDPRDMALSLKKAPMFRGGVLKGAKMWHDDQEGIHKYILSPHHNVLQLRYEDLLSDPHGILIELCNFLNVQYESSMLSFFQDKENKDYSKAVKEWSNISSPIIKNNTNKFLKQLSPEEIAYVEYRNMKMMHKYNYEITTYTEDLDMPAIIRKLEKTEPYDKPGYLDIDLSFREKVQKRNQLFHKYD